MSYKLESLKARNAYDINVIDETNDEQLIGLMVDTARKQYYVVLPENVSGERLRESYLFLRNNIISKIQDKSETAIKNDSPIVVGQTCVNVDERLSATLLDMGIVSITEDEYVEDTKYTSDLQSGVRSTYINDSNELFRAYR